jgi:F-type H+-transporting ATPase subunit epsilon
MADTMQFDLVAPERLLVSGEAKSVTIPGSEGDMVAMADHMPLITTLRPGVLVAEMADGQAQEFVVTGGFAEVTASATSVLAEVAVPRAEATSEMIAERLEAAKRAAAEASSETIDAANKRVADLEALGALIG